MAYSKIKRTDLTFGAKLGEGGSSTVYQVTWRQLWGTSKEVAVKTLHKVLPNEVEIMSKLDHPNIVKLLGVVDEKPEFYLLLELCKGGSLREYLDKHPGKRLPSEQFYDWAKQVAMPIQYLRKNGIVHKDVKSPNYLIADLSILKLADFGLAKKIDTTMSNATGSASYNWMAPELLREFILSPSYDIFALAVVLWELWTMAMPFKGLEPQVIMWRICKKNKRPPIPSDCPKPLADLMRQCWEVDWHKRPSIDHVLAVITDTEAAVPAAAAPTAAAQAAAATTAAATAAAPAPAPAAAAAAAAAAAKASKAERQRAIINGPWELERKVKSTGPQKLRPCGIAVKPNGDIAVTDHMVDKVQVYSSEGANKLSLNTSEGLKPGTESSPQEVRFSPEGQYYVTDKTQYVKVYDVNGLYKRKWVAVSPQHKPSDTENTKLLGIIIDVKNQLLVGETKHMYISKHKLDGSHIASIKVGIEPSSLAVTSQDAIIISDWDKSVGSVHIVDPAGQLMHTIKPPTDVQGWDPAGIACFEDIICICYYDGKSICCFSVSGEYLGSIPIQIPGNPRCLTFTADGNKLLFTYSAGADGGVAVYKSQR